MYSNLCARVCTINKLRSIQRVHYFHRLRQCMSLSGSLANEDCFENQKQQSFKDSFKAALGLLNALDEARTSSSSKQRSTEEEFNLFFKVSLWGNKADLSISGGVTISVGEEGVQDLVEKLQPNVIIDQTDAVWKLVNNNQCSRVDFVMDNVGYELIADLALADLMITQKMAKTIVFHLKSVPW